MNTYNEIFLPIELNKALQNILSNVHHHYREHKIDTDETIKEKQLREIYKPILNCPVLKKNIVWFNAWKRLHTGKPEVYFIKKCRNIPKRILRVYREKTKEYNQYVSSLSTLAKDYNIVKKSGKQTSLFDYACLITEKKYYECDIDMASEYVRDFFVYLNFEILTELFKKINFSKHYLSIRDAFGKSEETGNEKIIELLKENYVWLSKNTREINDIVSALTEQLSSSWQCSRKFGDDLDILIKDNKILDSNHDYLNEDNHRKNVIKLINYYFWVKLAFQKTKWKVLLYFPGVIAKEFEGIPLGVNIGLKEMVPLEIILFLKRAILLFFTRESVDYFEDKAKREAMEIAHLLFEFPHIVGNYVSRAIGRSLQFGDIQTASELAWFIGKAGTYMSSTLATSKPSKEKYKLKECLEKFKNIPLGLTLDTPINNISAYNSELTTWKSMFCPGIDIADSLTIWLPEGVLEAIISNLLSNTKKNNKHNPCVSISAKKENDQITLIYKEVNSEGFTLEIIKNIKRWAMEGPREDEYTKGFGYRSIYKASVEICKGKFEIIILYKQKEIDILSDDIPDDLGNNKLHPIHRFTFKTDFDNESEDNTLDIFE